MEAPGDTVRAAAAAATLATLIAVAAAGCGAGRPSASTTPGTGASPTATATSSTTPSPTVTLSQPPAVRIQVVAKLDQPLGMAVRAGDPALYVVSKAGRVWALRSGRVDPTPVLDVAGQVSRGSEQGLLGMAFSADGRFVYVDYTDRGGDTNVVEFAWSNGRADASTRRLVLFVRQPFPNHNGGDLVFGPDGYLYVGLGDGGSSYTRGDPQGDPHRNGQDLGTLLGKMLRIEPRMPDGSLPAGGAGYAVPGDNPFVDTAGARPEIWAYGLRNPWRYSFDRRTGDLWIADVGAGLQEEVDLQPAGSAGGQNYGWNAVEGTVVYRGPPADAVAPVFTYNHSFGGCAITGGYVYRGDAMPGLRGWYVFGDFCLGTIEALQLSDGARDVTVSGASIPELASFGQDQRGELYALSLAGTVYRLVP